MDYKFNVYLYLGILLIVFLNNLKYRLLYTQNFFGVFIMGFLTTLPHEIAHYLVAALLGGRPQGLSIIPKKTEHNGYVYWSFGNVRACANKFTGFFIGIAPVIWLIAGYFIAKYYFLFFSLNEASILGFFLIEWIMIENGIPSREDIKEALKSTWGALFFMIVAGILLYRSWYE